MAYKNILVVSDNMYLQMRFKQIANSIPKTSFAYITSKEVNLDKASRTYDLLISLHSQKIFPKKVVNRVKCINIHPGHNPHNRGFGSQVFSILNKRPFGVTIHEMDEKIDHGPIIDQIEVPIYPWDTSSTAYDRMLGVEVELIKKNLKRIVAGTYKTKEPFSYGNFNSMKDFDKLCELNLHDCTSLGEFIDRLRALTHGGYNNAFFIDEKTHKRIYVSINLKIGE